MRLQCKHSNENMNAAHQEYTNEWWLLTSQRSVMRIIVIVCLGFTRDDTKQSSRTRRRPLSEHIKTNTCTARRAVNHPHVENVRLFCTCFGVRSQNLHSSWLVQCNGIFFAFYYRRQFRIIMKWKRRQTDIARTHTFRLLIRSKSALDLCNWIIMHASRLDTGWVCVLSFNGNVCRLKDMSHLGIGVNVTDECTRRE